MIINDLIAGITSKLRNRDDVTYKIPTYIKKAVLDLTQNYEFDELRRKGPVTNFIANKSEYARDFFTQPGDGYCTFIVSWFVYFDTNVTPGQSTGFVLKYRQPRVVENMSVIPGIPTVYTQVGEQVNAGNIIVGYMPNTGYATYMRYQKQHPFPVLPENDEQTYKQAAQAKIYMPDDWSDILEYAAAEKACDDIGMLDVGTLYHQKIYGNPQKRQPGLIAERMSQQQRQAGYNEGQMRLVVRKV